MDSLISFYDPAPADLLEYQKAPAVPVSQLYVAICDRPAPGDDWIDQHGIYHPYSRNDPPTQARRDETASKYHYFLNRLRKQRPICPLLLFFSGDNVSLDQGRHRLAAIKAYSTETHCDLMVSVLLRRLDERRRAACPDSPSPDRFPAWLAAVTMADLAGAKA